jgi:hypothetical protein
MLPAEAKPNDRAWTFGQTAAACYALFLCFFMFQAMAGFLGYQPLRVTGYVHYAFRTLLVLVLFLGPLALLARGARLRSLVGAGWSVFLAVTVVYVAVIVARRPELNNANDRNEALSLAIRSILAGEFPYLQLTPLGNPITPLTATFLTALPAELALRRPELMSLPMLALATGCLLWLRRDSAGRESGVPPMLLVTLLLLNPIVIWELAWASDLLWGSVMLLTAMALLRAGRPGWAAAVFGAALCTRLGFGLLVPLWGGYLFRAHGRRAWQYLAIAAAVALALELPLFLWNPHQFWNLAPVRPSFEKLAYGFPPGDNGLTDLLNFVFPEWMGKIVLSGGGLALLSAGLGWRVRSLRELSFATAGFFGVALILMGTQFEPSYLVWVLVPVLTGLALPAKEFDETA